MLSRGSAGREHAVVDLLQALGLGHAESVAMGEAYRLIRLAHTSWSHSVRPAAGLKVRVELVQIQLHRLVVAREQVRERERRVLLGDEGEYPASCG